MAVTADDRIKALAGTLAKRPAMTDVAAGAMAGVTSPPKPAVQSAPSAPTAATTAIKQPTSRSNETLGRIDSLINQQPFQFQAPGSFSYNKDTDPAYQAALAAAQSNIQQGQADTNARLRAAGQGKSSYSESVANQISAKEMGNVSTNVLPQLISQAYQRYADDANRSLQLQQLNYGAQQDQIGQLGNLYSLYDQQDFRNPLMESEVTGNYLPGEARNYINSILELKRRAETPGVTAQERAGLSQQADAYRAALQGLGIDPSAYGAAQTANQATASFDAGAGIRTLAGQQMDLQQRQSNLDAALAVGQATGRLITPQTDIGGLFRQASNADTPLNLAGQQFAYGQQRDQVGDGQWQQQFDRAKYESDRDYQYRSQQQAIANDQWQQQFQLDVDRYGFQRASEMWSQAFQEQQAGRDYDMRQQQMQQSMSETERTAAQQAIANVANSGLVVPATDSRGNPTGGYTVPDANKFRDYVLSLNLPDNVTDSIFLQYGQGQLVKAAP